MPILAATVVNAEELTVSAWGGFFEETLAAEIYPGFTEKNGIEVKSIAQPEDSAWMTQLMAAARAKKAPAGFRCQSVLGRDWLVRPY